MKKMALAITFLIVASPAFAICKIDGWTDAKAHSENYFVKMGGMMVRGVHRIISSPVPLVTEPYEDIVTEKHYATGLFTGLFTGVGQTLKEIGLGAVDIVGSFCPTYQGVDAVKVQA